MSRIGCVAQLLAAGSLACAQQTAIDQEHTKWIAGVIESIQTIKPGMTRGDLLRLFTTEGGIWTHRERIYVYKQCPYIKVKVEFEAAGNAESWAQIPQDRIVKISAPFLHYFVVD